MNHRNVYLENPVRMNAFQIVCFSHLSIVIYLLFQLFEILSDDSFTDVIGWLGHGKGFMIRDKKAFAERVLSKYFKKSKFTSFTRKLNRW